MDETKPMTSPNDPPGGLGGLQTNVLAGSTHKASDLNLLRRAIRERWPIPPDKRPEIVQRLVDIAGSTETNVTDREGKEYVSYDAADKNAIQAARVLVAMDGLNQTDEHLADKNDRIDNGKDTERFGGTVFVKGIDPDAL